MTDSLLRRTRPKAALAPLQRSEIEEARALCARNPVAYIMPAMHLDHAASTGRLLAGQLWVVREGVGGRLRGRSAAIAGVIWTGANLVPALPEATPEFIAEVAAAAGARLARPSALVGDAEVVLGLWSFLSARWGPAREIRPEQWLMRLDGQARYPAPPRPGDPLLESLRLEAVRTATLADFEDLLPAAVHMFVGEVGYDPLEHGRTAYEDRLRRLIRLGRSFVQFGVVEGRRQVVFKAEAGVVGGGVAELQGVWVHPLLRGRGFGRAGVAAVVERSRATLAPVTSLYVNDFNARAITAYEAVGFTRVGTFATVML